MRKELFRHLLGMTEENYKTLSQDSQSPEHLPITSLERYR